MSISSEDVTEVLKTLDSSPVQKETSEAPVSEEVASEVPQPSVDIDAELLNQLNDPKNWVFTEEEMKKKTVEEMKAYLSEKSLSTKGNKKDLIQRILENQ